MLHEYCNRITPADRAAAEACRRRWNSIAKPLNGMGVLEEMIVKLAAVQASADVDISRRCAAVMCADNGVVAQGITQSGSEVTAVVAANIMKGDASVANMARVAGADVFVYDVGMLTEVEGVSVRKVARGTCDFSKQPAMTREQAEQIVVNGIDIAGELAAKGYRLIACGEMGIGNTTTSSAVASLLLGVDPAEVTGRGAGLSAEGVVRKTGVIRDAIGLHRPEPSDALDVLSKVGGFDIAAMCGLFLGGAVHHVCVIIDGLISSVAALLACRICPAAADYMLPSHLSAEPAARMLAQQLGMQPPITAGMALGEGTGAVALMPLLDMALEVYRKMPTFADVSIEEYKPL